jgi:hypothetical protein
MFNARVVADSTCNGHRITSVEVTMPKYLVAELNTHRAFSRNSASSRAIPFKKMVESVKENPFIPIAWQKDHKGMQGSEYIEDDDELAMCEWDWMQAFDFAIQQAESLHDSLDVTKQICNRLLEPFMWTTVLITATEWENFFKQRCPKYHFEPSGKDYRSRKEFVKQYNDTFFGSHISIEMRVDYWSEFDWLKINKGQADIHMMKVAELIYDVITESEPSVLEKGYWHIPYGNEICESDLNRLIKASVGRCARASYITIGDESDYTTDKLIKVHDKLLEANPIHASPLEHVAWAMTAEHLERNPRSGNFTGWIQYREIIEEYKKNAPKRSKKARKLNRSK